MSSLFLISLGEKGFESVKENLRDILKYALLVYFLGGLIYAMPISSAEYLLGESSNVNLSILLEILFFVPIFFVKLIIEPTLGLAGVVFVLFLLAGIFAKLGYSKENLKKYALADFLAFLFIGSVLRVLTQEDVLLGNIDSYFTVKNLALAHIFLMAIQIGWRLLRERRKLNENREK